jgi:hypothetical protein
MPTLPTEELVPTSDYSHQQLVDALLAEWAYMIHDDFNPEEDLTEEEYGKHLSTLTHAELLAEIDCDDEYYPLSQFMHAWT